MLNRLRRRVALAIWPELLSAEPDNPSVGVIPAALEECDHSTAPAASMVGARIRLIRVHKGLTRDEFAHLLGVKPSKIQDIETGRQRVIEDFVCSLVSALPVDLNWLFTGRGWGPENTCNCWANDALADQFDAGEFGRRLRSERVRLALSQTAFAALADQQKNSQIRYEKGERVPRADYLASVTRAGVDLQYLFTGERAKSEEPPKC